MSNRSLTAQEFVAKWRRTGLKERSPSQERTDDVCQLVGLHAPAEAHLRVPGAVDGAP